MAYKPWKSSDSVILNPQELQDFSGGYLGKFNFNESSSLYDLSSYRFINVENENKKSCSNKSNKIITRKSLWWNITLITNVVLFSDKIQVIRHFRLSF